MASGGERGGEGGGGREGGGGITRRAGDGRMVFDDDGHDDAETGAPQSPASQEPTQAINTTPNGGATQETAEASLHRSIVRLRRKYAYGADRRERKFAARVEALQRLCHALDLEGGSREPIDDPVRPQLRRAGVDADFPAPAWVARQRERQARCLSGEMTPKEEARWERRKLWLQEAVGDRWSWSAPEARRELALAERVVRFVEAHATLPTDAPACEARDLGRALKRWREARGGRSGGQRCTEVERVLDANCRFWEMGGPVFKNYRAALAAIRRTGRCPGRIARYLRGKGNETMGRLLLQKCRSVGGEPAAKEFRAAWGL